MTFISGKLLPLLMHCFEPEPESAQSHCCTKGVVSCNLPCASDLTLYISLILQIGVTVGTNAWRLMPNQGA